MSEDVGLAQGTMVFLGLSVGGGLILLLVRDSRVEFNRYLKLFLIAYAVRYAMAVAIYAGGLVSVLKDEDASGWTGGVALYQIWCDQNDTLFDIPYGLSYMFGDQQPGPNFLRAQHRGFYYVTAAIFFVTNSPYRLVAAALNGFAGALTVAFSAMTAGRLFGAAAARRTGWYVCFFPSMIIWSAMTIKEPIVICLETAVLYNCICMRQKRYSLVNLAGAALFSAFLAPFRLYGCWVFAFLTILCLLVPDWSTAGRETLRTHKRCALLCLPLFLYFAYQLLMKELVSQKFDLSYVQSFRGSISQGGEINGAGSGVESSFDMTSPLGLGFAILFGGAHLLLAPFPWQLGGASLRMLFTLPELLFWWYLFAFGVVPGTVYTVRHRLSETWMLFIVLLTFGTLYSVMFGNIGLIFRQRAQLLPILLTLGAVGRQRVSERRKTLRQSAPRFISPTGLPAADPPPAGHPL